MRAGFFYFVRDTVRRYTISRFTFSRPPILEEHGNEKKEY